ncbi:MAG: ankyrin repeat protein [Chthonomonadaceae bacterium]|nr:ankyrin repeat protein [Chthonomonadaceae bacterium]
MQRKRLSWLILLLLIGMVGWGGYRTARQSTLNHALILASRANDPSEVLMQLNRGADPNAHEDKTSETGLQHLLNILLLHKHKRYFSSTSPLFQAMPGDTILQGTSLVHLVMTGASSGPGRFFESSAPSLNNNQFEIARILLEHGADPNIKLPDGTPSPSHWWFEARDDRLSTLFLQHGANPNNIDSVGNSALMYAVDSHNEMLVQTALMHGARPDLANNQGDTALMWAACDHDVKAIKLLLSAGGDVNHKDKSGYSALTYAVANGNSSSRARAIKNGSSVAFSARECKETIDLLLAAGADVNASDQQGCSPFLLAVNEWYIDVNNMLAHGADVRRAIPLSAPTQDVSWTLIGFGGGVGNQTTPGTTPLMSATVLQRADLVRKMLAMGADVNARDAKGKTALYYAQTCYTPNAANASEIRALLQHAIARR